MPTLLDAQIKPSIDTFVKEKGRQPTTPSEWSSVYRLAYPDQTKMPVEFQKVVNQAAASANTPIGSRQSELDVLGLQRGAAGAESQTAQQTAQTASLTPGRFNILQEALRAKQGSQALGTSSIFEKAGLTGYGALAASLQSRAKEMDINYENYSNTIQSAFAGVIDVNKQLIDKANLALDNYKMISDRYKEVSDQIFTLERDEQEYKRRVDLAVLEASLKNASATNKLTLSEAKGWGAPWAQGMTEEGFKQSLYSETAPTQFIQSMPVNSMEVKGQQASYLPTGKGGQQVIKNAWNTEKQNILQKVTGGGTTLSNDQLNKMASVGVPNDIANDIQGYLNSGASEESILDGMTKSFGADLAQKYIKAYKKIISTGAMSGYSFTK